MTILQSRCDVILNGASAKMPTATIEFQTGILLYCASNYQLSTASSKIRNALPDNVVSASSVDSFRH